MVQIWKSVTCLLWIKLLSVDFFWKVPKLALQISSHYLLSFSANMEENISVINWLINQSRPLQARVLVSMWGELNTFALPSCRRWSHAWKIFLQLFLESFTVMLTWKFIECNHYQFLSSKNWDLRNILILIFDVIPSLKNLQSNGYILSPFYKAWKKKIFDVFLTFNVWCWFGWVFVLLLDDQSFIGMPSRVVRELIIYLVRTGIV